ncbi:MAG: hypothetical protein GX446_00595 [Chthonomonadales bacterium]|nr:hypothetical protein [Chthonomonadales bacterium]
MLLPLAPAAWTGPAPSQIPAVTVRWEDPEQRDVVVVEGARYRCRVGTLPARILSLSVDDSELLGPDGMSISARDPKGATFRPAPPGITPVWKVWRGQRWQPATSARARMNVWNAGPHYYDAHILDIPMLSDEDLHAYAEPETPPLKAWDFADDNGECLAINNITLGRAPDGAMRIAMTGADPHMSLPGLDVRGPITVRLRLRTGTSGGGAIYWATDGGAIAGTNVATFPVIADSAWHDYDIAIESRERITALRFDPPGESGTADVASVRVFGPRESRPEPIRGEIVLHAQPERLGIEVKLAAPEARAAPERVILDPDAAPTRATANGRALFALGKGRTSVAGLAAPGAVITEGEIALPASSAWIVVKPSDGRSPEQQMQSELQPLAEGSVRIQGGHWAGYDPAAGIYTATLAHNGPAFAFDPSFHNPTRRMAAAFDVTNDTLPRDVLMRLATSTGNLEAGVLTDPHGFPLPVPGFVCKNFAGEMEEPDDTAYGDVYFALRLNANERRRFTVHPLTHGWGIWPLKQVSSIRFFLIYWHCSTGASETTCWSMDWMAAKGAIFHIPDFRPMSGPFWPGQPQHDCQHWPGWLQYNGAKGRLCYERTVFDSIAPNLARFTMHFHTSDRTARATVEAWEAPQRDEARTMVRLRYDWDQPCAIEGDARRNFRWLNINHFRWRNEMLLWTGPDGETIQREVPPSGDFVILGEPMSSEAPFMACEGPGEKYNVLALVRSFKARLGGKEYDRPAFSAAFDAQDASSWLTVNAERLELQPGDWLEAEIMLMPHGEPTPPGFKAERERVRFGLKPVTTTVTRGQKVSDYPPHVRAREDVAAFRLEGGHGDLPMIVDGFQGWKVPLLWMNGVWQDHQVHGGDGYQVQPDEHGGYRFIFTVPHRDGQQPELMVTRAECSGDIRSLRDVNGFLVMDAAASGTWRLKAPAAFAPGRNTVRRGDPAIGFTGAGTTVRQVPLTVEPEHEGVDVVVERWDVAGIALRCSRGATMTISGLRPGADYTVTVDGKSRVQPAPEGKLTVKASQAASVRIAPVPNRQPLKSRSGAPSGEHRPVASSPRDGAADG